MLSHRPEQSEMGCITVSVPLTDLQSSLLAVLVASMAIGVRHFIDEKQLKNVLGPLMSPRGSK